jgi:hypothetical protein
MPRIRPWKEVKAGEGIQKPLTPAIGTGLLPKEKAFVWEQSMKSATSSIVGLAVLAAISSARAQDADPDQRETGGLCWDTLHNVARQSQGSSTAGDPPARTTGSARENKAQERAAEPKDSNRVTSGVTGEGRMISGSTARPTGVPDC